MIRAKLTSLVAVGFLGLVFVADVWARPGGGHGFGGGGGGGGFHGGGGGGGGFHGGGFSSHSSGGHFSGSGGSADAGVVLLLVALMFIAMIGVPVVLAIMNKTGSNWSTSTVDTLAQPPEPGLSKTELARLRSHDPNLSIVLLEDFVHELYVRAHEARADAASLSLLAPYIDAERRKALLDRKQGPLLAVRDIVVGASDLVKLRVLPERALLSVDFIANYTELIERGGQSLRFYVRERWTLERRLTAKSRHPDEWHAFNCPKCGGPVSLDHERACEYCNAPFTRGEHEWFVVGIRVDESTLMPPQLGGYSEEVHGGPTRVDPSLHENLAILQREDPAFDVAAAGRRVEMIYHRLNAAWTSLDWAAVRPFTTDRFWLSQTYWIDAYRSQGLRNRMDDAKVTRVELVKATRDAFFWALTVRVFASAIDTTVHEASGRRVGGSATPRKYSEYWTFIRSIDRHAATIVTPTCPACGADAKVGMTGNCDACGVKLTGGAYDWVLSKIEQDEVYR
ncbi:MAG: TIM44-like domain-containing protein [Nannocystaceae bacterium]|nr:TIM44-like domain-containing protein [Nannocystaceae bacterium]